MKITCPNWLKRMHRDERGLEGLEYLLVAALIIISCVAAWGVLAKTISLDVNKVANAVSSATDSSLAIAGYKPSIFP